MRPGTARMVPHVQSKITELREAIGYWLSTACALNALINNRHALTL